MVLWFCKIGDSSRVIEFLLGLYIIKQSTEEGMMIQTQLQASFVLMSERRGLARIRETQKKQSIKN